MSDYAVIGQSLPRIEGDVKVTGQATYAGDVILPGTLQGEGSFVPASTLHNPAYGFGAQIAEVEVDPETGQVTVLHVTSAHDCGRPINPLAVEGQTEGSIHMGVGWTLMEGLQMEEGRLLNPNFLEHKNPHRPGDAQRQRRAFYHGRPGRAVRRQRSG